MKFAEVPYLPTINDPKLTRTVSRVARQLLHETHLNAVEADRKFWELPPPSATMGAGKPHLLEVHLHNVILGIRYLPGIVLRLHHPTVQAALLLAWL